MGVRISPVSSDSSVVWTNTPLAHVISNVWRWNECLAWEAGERAQAREEKAAGSHYFSSLGLSGFVLTHRVARQNSQVGLWPHYARNSESKNLTSQEKEWVWIEGATQNQRQGRWAFSTAAQVILLAENPRISRPYLFCPAPHWPGSVHFRDPSKRVSVSQIFGYPKLAHVLYCLFPLII